MQLGILTESGVVMNAAPILLGDEKGFMGILKKNNRNEEISQLIDLTKRLKKIDSLKDKKAIYKSYGEKEKVLNDIITILANGDSAMAANGNMRMFKYSNELDLIRGQQGMIELGFHCLMYADNVRYEFKRDYYEILSQIFNRDELQLANVALCPEFMEERKSSEVSFSKSLSIKQAPVKNAKTGGQLLPENVKKETEHFEDLQYERVK